MTNTPTTGTEPSTVNAGGFRVAAWTPRERADFGLWTDMVRATAAVRARLAERLDAELGMVPEDVDLLMRLEEAPEQRLRMADVSRSLQLSKSGVTRLVDRLGARGLVERAACPSDRRVVYAGLTDDGRRALEQAAPLLRVGLLEHLGRHLRPRELDSVRAALGKIAAAEAVRP
ncbi:MAG TPA: MarR family transcriptional regulator [Thermoleophilia bacterium]